MVITYHGDNYFKIQSGNITVLIDPTSGRSFRGADLILNTLKPSPVSSPIDGTDCFWIDHQGEYERKGIGVRGWSAGSEGGKEKTIYRVVFDEINLLVLGHLTKEPDKEVREYLSGADVVFIPAGGNPFISQSTAAKLIRQIEPSIVIPSLFKNPRNFLREFNQPKCDFEEKLVIKSKNLRPGTMEIKCLK
ncbi:MAG: MBL fold metallo-hydrolase [Patescibacteria group bacterium]|nr:MBL fold metallo-hydrolase [Patescibacteria group bacterium]